MSTGNNLEDIYNNSIRILKDLIAFKTVSGEDNNQLIDYCDDILNSLGASSFKTYDEEKKRVNLFSTLKAKKKSKKKPIISLYYKQNQINYNISLRYNLSLQVLKNNNYAYFYFKQTTLSRNFTWTACVGGQHA